MKSSPLLFKRNAVTRNHSVKSPVEVPDSNDKYNGNNTGTRHANENDRSNDNGRDQHEHCWNKHNSNSLRGHNLRRMLFIAIFAIVAANTWQTMNLQIHDQPFPFVVDDDDSDDDNGSKDLPSRSYIHEPSKNDNVEDRSRRVDSLSSDVNVEMHMEMLDDWRVVTDCNMYDFACPVHKKFRPYPFHNLRELQSHTHKHKLVMLDEDQDDINITSSLTLTLTLTLKGSEESKGYQNLKEPPMVSNEEKTRCLNVAHNQTLKEQIERVIKQLNPIEIKLGMKSGIDIDREVENFVAFTITDENYANEMLHEVHQMNRKVVRFGDAHFFVGMDLFSVDLACSFGYPVVYFHQSDNENENENENEDQAKEKEKDNEHEHEHGQQDQANEDNFKTLVQSSKLIISQMLVDMNQSFVFYEMDIWFLKSPIHMLQQEMNGDMLASSHQNNPFNMNIGFFAVRATNASKEYFKNCVDTLRRAPDAHDQVIMNKVSDASAYRGLRREKEIELDGGGTVPAPNVTHLFIGEKLDPHVIVSHAYPIVTEATVAVHFLAEKPLQGPFGKIILAKEMGVWYGFESDIEPKINVNDTITSGVASPSLSTGMSPTMTDTSPGMGGYYKRTGAYRRYLLLDSDGTLGGYTQQRSTGYHSDRHLRWTMAILITIARRTNRILILPKVLTDTDTKFVWTRLDMSSVEDLGVQYRETNFPSNKKSWYSKSLPFSSIARVAPYGGDGRLLFYTSNTTELHQGIEGKMKGWRMKDHEGSVVYDGLFATITAIPEVYNAEALFVNPVGLVDSSSGYKLNAALADVKHIYDSLRWCEKTEMNLFTEFVENLWTPSGVQSFHHCYRKGVPAK